RALLQAAHAGGALLRLRCTVAPHPGPARADRLAAGARRSLLQPLRAGLPPPRRGPPHRRAGRLGLTSRGSYQRRGADPYGRRWSAVPEMAETGVVDIGRCRVPGWEGDPWAVRDSRQVRARAWRRGTTHWWRSWRAYAPGSRNGSS